MIAFRPLNNQPDEYAYGAVRRWDMSASFSDLYEMWLDRGGGENEPEVAMRALYRHAWNSGDSTDRYYILHFIFERELWDEGLDLFRDAIGLADVNLAVPAAILFSMINSQGRDLTSADKEAWEAFRANFPEQARILGVSA